LLPDAKIGVSTSHPYPSQLEMNVKNYVPIFESRTNLAKQLAFALTLLFSLLIGGNNGFAQQQKGIPSDGRDFYLGFMTSSIRCPAVQPFINVYALVTSYYDNVIKVSYFDQSGKEIPGRSYVVQKQHSVQIQLDRGQATLQDPAGGTPEYKAIHITAKSPVNIQYYSTGPNSGGMYLSLPTAALGLNYIVASLPANPGIGAGGRRFGCNGTYLDSNSSEFMIVAPYDDTKVTITPNGTTAKGRVGATTGTGANGIGQPFEVTLMRGQVYLVKSQDNDAEVDESSSIVQSDKPVAVIAGNDGAHWGDSKYAANGQEQRDLCIEQMVPVEFWDGKDNISMPFVDSPVSAKDDPSAGEAYRVYTFDPKGTTVNFAIDAGATQQRSVSRLTASTVEFDNVTTGITATASDAKIFVAQYDYRQHNSSEPFPAPSQMNVVPISRWRKSFLWMVPDDAAQVHKKHYINIIASKLAMPKILLAKDGAPPQPITKNANVGGFAHFPGHPELEGRRIELSPGSYYATGDSAFIIYQYGNLGLDPDNDLGDNDDDDYYFSYAAPCGQSFGIDSSASPSLKVDTACASWTVTAWDSIPVDNGLADVQLLDDPAGVYTRPGYVSFNTILDPSSYQVKNGALWTQFGVKVINPLKDAYAVIFIVNRAGNDTLIELRYKAPKLTLAPDSADFSGVVINDQVCARFVMRNTGAKGEKNFVLTGADFLLKDKSFSLSSVTPNLPYTLKPGDSVVFNVCYTALDTGLLHLDTLLMHTDCSDIPVQVTGQGVTPLIVASDVDFGTVVLGDSNCNRTVRITNVGTGALILTTGWLLHNNIEFRFSDAARLPITLKPGESVSLSVCYTPHKVGTDSTLLDWGTNLREPFLHQIKDFSKLIGRATKSTLVWNVIKLVDTVECTNSDTMRVTLTNKGGVSTTIRELKFIGADSAEYTILRNQHNFNPIVGNPIDSKDSLWIDVVFTPDLSKPIGRWADRHATLIVKGDRDTSFEIVDFTSVVIHADMTLSTNSIDFGTVQILVPVQRKIVISNPGTAPLHLTSIVFPNPPVTRILGINVGDIIPPGGSDTVTVEAELTDPGDTTVECLFTAATQCPPPGKLTVHLQAATLEVQGTGKKFDSTFLYCRMDTGATNALNLGTTPVTLVSAQIISDATHPDGDQFTFSDGSQKISLTGVILKKGESYPFSVHYNPTREINARALIRYTWDTSGVVWTTDAQLFGTGAFLHDTISAQALDGKPITAKTGEIFDVPVRLSTSFSPTAAVYGYRFNVVFREDLFHYVDATPGSGPAFSPTPSPVSIGNGDVMLSVRALGNQPITTASIIADLRLQLMVSRDLSSDFTILDGAFLDKNGDSLCYVQNANINGSFTPIDLCGDGTVRAKLNDKLAAAVLSSIIPNPAKNTAKVHFIVRTDDEPVTIELYNILGKKVATVVKEMPYKAGEHTAKIDLAGIPSGTYTLRLSTPESSQGRVMMISK
jgi:hypothetical protein